jgi:membrane glycosyltransferase
MARADTGRVTMRGVLWAALVAVVSVLAFLLLDPIVAAFVVILLVTGAVIAFVARDWDQHSTYEEREAARARKRAEKWERSADARARDRARWEAHQARQAGRSEQ